MLLMDFFSAVEADPVLVGVAIEMDEMKIVVGCRGRDDVVVFNVDVVLAEPWPTLRGLATGQRQIAPCYHVSRIVGYYSRIENWNPSKIGELRDRRNGNYTIPETVAENRNGN